MRRISWIAAAAVATVMLIGCETASYVTSEVTGTAKPAGGIQQSVPATRSFKGSPAAVRSAVLEVLDEQGYVYEENPSTGTIKTEPKYLGDQSKVMFMGASYSAKVFIKLKGSAVTFKATFNKKSNLTEGGENIEYPEKENELRKKFFDALGTRLG
jgi:hypothetical protein